MSLVVRTDLKRSKYRILGLVGQGQFGRVFCAVHRQTGHLVAIKHLDQQRFPTHKFLRELRFLLSLKHPNIVMFHALEHTSTGRYLIMDYCEGGTLRGLMTDECQPTLRQSIKLITDILLGLEQAHNHGIVHCDIKPENILLSLEPYGWTARISDFGIAKLSQDIAEQELGNTGSPAYMAPERFYGQFSKASDLYSVGILLFELLAGYRPFSGTPSELMSAHLNKPLKIPDTIPQHWHPILTQSLQKLAGRRYKSAGDMLTDIRAVSGIENDGKVLQSMPLHCSASKIVWAEAAITALTPSVAPISTVAAANRLTPLIKDLDPGLDLYQAIANQLTVYPRPEKMWLEPYESQSAQCVTLPDPIAALEMRPQGCFIIGDRTVDLLPSVGQSLPIRILDLPTPMKCSIEPNGQWMATLTCDSPAQPALQFWPTALYPHWVVLFSRPLIQTLRPGRQLHQVLAIDTRHIALIFSVPPKSSSDSGLPQAATNTVFKIYTRRGQCIGSLTMPLHPGALIPTATPYRFLSLDRDNPNSILLIDLKPYRLSRISLPIKPQFLAASSWGFIAADEMGHVVLLDGTGQQVGWLQTSSGVTAISCYGHTLVVATWQDNEGEFQVIDLRESAVDIVF